MTSLRPYMVKAVLAWLTDNGEVPLAHVDASFPGTVVPTAFVKDDRIVLNLSMHATDSLTLGDDAISFRARFAGRSFDLYVPMGALLFLHAKGNADMGMVFPQELVASPLPSQTQDAAPLSVAAKTSTPPPSTDGSSSPRRGHLRVVK